MRFKNQGLDSIEVQDNGSGIAPHNYETVALKHYTSKLSSYDDLETLQTFGFRGEALSSLCALSRLSIVTCTQEQAPRAARLEFEPSGKLKSTTVVSGQRGTTVIVEDLFRSLPVRRRELERNIKREWGKVINLLNQYACIQTGVKFTVTQQPTKGKRMVMFSTKGNLTTRENIINVFGVKTMNALVPMDLTLELIPTAGPLTKGKARTDRKSTEVRVVGHISRPTHGEGRSTPDRQMFYVNGRPCGLPQFAKVFNEVYRLYNSSQSPFIFADIQLDTHLYDVNVSPDKRTILLHDQGQMLDNLRESLIELFETQDVIIPMSRVAALKQTSSKISTARPSPSTSPQETGSKSAAADSRLSKATTSFRAMENTGDNANEESANTEDNVDDVEKEDTRPRQQPKMHFRHSKPQAQFKGFTTLSNWLRNELPRPSHPSSPLSEEQATEASTRDKGMSSSVTSAGDRGDRIPQSQVTGDTNVQDDERSLLPDVGKDDEIAPNEPESPIRALCPPSQPPTLRMSSTPSKPLKRATQEMATITIGDHTVRSAIGNPSKKPRVDEPAKPVVKTGVLKGGMRRTQLPSFGGRLSQLFSASTQPEGDLELIEDAGKGIEEHEVIEEKKGEEGREEDDGHDSSDDDADGLFVSQDGNKDAEDEGSDEGQPEEILKPMETDQPQSMSDADVPVESLGTHLASCDQEHEDNDFEYVDEEEKVARENQKVQAMIQEAEIATAESTEETEKRSETFVKGRPKRKDMTCNLVQRVKANCSEIRRRIEYLSSRLPQEACQTTAGVRLESIESEDAEAKLSLKISKSDFTKMRIVGQFNLGFILAVREAVSASSSTSCSRDSGTKDDDELFIIDQHASDEKYNFERLQATTTVQSQRLVQPKTLSLTALEEEIILANLPALERNGFSVSVDTSGASPVGSRIQLLTLPLSRETTFSIADLEELIFLLADNPTSNATTVPRPSKVRKMFAMRACRSSIMIGRALSLRQMEKVVRHMGEMDKPWNCPHGRPTMRHLCGLGATWDGGRLWMEGDGFVRDGDDDGRGRRTDWAKWVRIKKAE